MCPTSNNIKNWNARWWAFGIVYKSKWHPLEHTYFCLKHISVDTYCDKFISWNSKYILSDLSLGLRRRDSPVYGDLKNVKNHKRHMKIMNFRWNNKCKWIQVLWAFWWHITTTRTNTSTPVQRPMLMLPKNCFVLCDRPTISIQNRVQLNFIQVSSCYFRFMKIHRS